MDEQQERVVVQGLRAGKTEAWQALYEAYAERVWRSVARLLGPSAADVADVVQETMLAAARSAATFDPGRGALWLWLWGIARRQVACTCASSSATTASGGPAPGWPRATGGCCAGSTDRSPRRRTRSWPTNS